MKKQLKIFTNISCFFRDIFSRRTPNGQNEVKIDEKTEEFEHCVICGKLTRVPISMPIEWRENYEIGMGQICAECARREREATWGNTLTTARILQAVEQCRKENNKP